MSAGIDVVRRKQRRTGGPPGLQPKASRNVAMVAMRREGAAYREIAERFGVSHNRVWQIVSRELWRAAAQHHPSDMKKPPALERVPRHREILGA